YELPTNEESELWHAISPSQLPEALDGEGAFAASNSCIALEDERRSSAASASDPNIWFATGGKAARVFPSPDRGKTWEAFNSPILHGPESAGIFSIAFRDAHHGVIAGGDYKRPDDDGPNLAFTEDGGQT